MQGGGARQVMKIEVRAPGSKPFTQPTEPPVGIDGSSMLGTAGGLARHSSAVGLSYTQPSPVVTPDFNWDLYAAIPC